MPLPKKRKAKAVLGASVVDETAVEEAPPEEQDKKDTAVVVQQVSKKSTNSKGDNKNGNSSHSNNNNNNIHSSKDERAALHAEIDFTPLTLQDIHDRLVELCRRVPKIPADGFRLDHSDSATTAADATNSTNITSTTIPTPHFPNDCPYDKTKIRTWAAALQHVLEEFHLLVALVSAATYRWASERSGAADQNLTALGQELARSQEQILGRVSPRIHDVLAPVVAVVTDKTVTTTTTAATTGEETIKTQQNYYITIPEDIDYVNLCHAAAARNAASLRQVVLANLDKLLRTVQDYMQAQVNDSQHDVARGFVY